MMNLQRGYLPEGKDRQHPVLDPDDAALLATTPMVWINPGVPTWYDTVGLTTTFPPTVIPPDLVVMPVTDNG